MGEDEFKGELKFIGQRHLTARPQPRQKLKWSQGKA